MKHQRILPYLLIAPALALAACSAGAAGAWPGPSDTAADDGDACAWRMPGPPPGRPMFAHPGLGPDGPPGPASPALQVIRSAVEIERLYREQGRAADVAALYQDILAKTQDPVVRSFAFGALARTELRPADAGKAIATLRRSLDESLQLLDAQHPGASRAAPAQAP